MLFASNICPIVPVKADFSAALQAAQDAAGAQHYPIGALYMVATPIGNLADISLRALHTLNLVDGIACEDTRHTQGMLHMYGIRKPLLSVHEHNEREAAQSIIERLQGGQRMAYVSDAGTPAVSDPGSRLCDAVRRAGLRVLPLPGASCITALLSAAGLAGESSEFVFAGFLPAKSTERQALIAALAQERRAVLWLEAPHRIGALAKDLAALGERRLTIGRELTKQFEQIHTLPAGALESWLAERKEHSSGEFVLALHPQAADAPAKHGGERVLRVLLQELPTKAAARLAAQITGETKNALYERALQIKGEISL